MTTMFVLLSNSTSCHVILSKIIKCHTIPNVYILTAPCFIGQLYFHF